MYKLKLNLSEVKSFSVFEGEIIVAEGFIDNAGAKFNVNRIFKPKAFQKVPSIKYEVLKDHA